MIVYHDIVSEEGISSWKQLGETIAGEALDDQSGTSVSLSTDVNHMAIEANSNNENGVNTCHIRVYRMDGTDSRWKQLGLDINGEASSDQS